MNDKTQELIEENNRLISERDALIKKLSELAAISAERDALIAELAKARLKVLTNSEATTVRLKVYMRK